MRKNSILSESSVDRQIKLAIEDASASYPEERYLIAITDLEHSIRQRNELVQVVYSVYFVNGKTIDAVVDMTDVKRIAVVEAVNEIRELFVSIILS